MPLFSRHGRIYEMRLMMDFNGNNRGYAFVVFSTKKEAQNAVRMLNNYEVMCVAYVACHFRRARLGEIYTFGVI